MTTVLVHVADGYKAVSIQQVRDDVLLLAKYGPYEPWTTTIRLEEDGIVWLVASALKEFAGRLLTKQLRDSVELELGSWK